MAVTRKRSDENKPAQRKRPPATTPESRENQVASLAVDLAEKQLRDGTASSQVITHYLKLVTTREQLEKERLRQGIELDKVKMEAMASGKQVEELYSKALNAMRSYSGQEPEFIDDDY